jgi:hypothetical protein
VSKNKIYSELIKYTEFIKKPKILVISARRSFKTTAALKLLKYQAEMHVGKYLFILPYNMIRQFLSKNRIKDYCLELANGSIIYFESPVSVNKFKDAEIAGLVLDEPDFCDQQELSEFFIDFYYIIHNSFFLTIGSMRCKESFLANQFTREYALYNLKFVFDCDDIGNASKECLDSLKRNLNLELEPDILLKDFYPSKYLQQFKDGFVK